MSIKRGVWRQGESQLAKDDGCEELVISDDPEIGGGRIIGEVCHFIDLCIFISG
mgnify:CR=1 FL=1